jgi:nitrogen fixation-related uncharacterized protein
MRLILAVFGIALALIIVWAMLWIVAARQKDRSNRLPGLRDD